MEFSAVGTENFYIIIIIISWRKLTEISINHKPMTAMGALFFIKVIYNFFMSFCEVFRLNHFLSLPFNNIISHYIKKSSSDFRCWTSKFYFCQIITYLTFALLPNLYTTSRIYHIYVKFYHKLEISGKAGRSWELDELEIFEATTSWKPYGALEKFVKFYISWKFI